MKKKHIEKFFEGIEQKNKEIKPLGQVTGRLENVLQEMAHDHKLQWGEILGLVYSWLSIHYPEGQEEYVTGGSPVYYYGPRKD